MLLLSGYFAFQCSQRLKDKKLGFQFHTPLSDTYNVVIFSIQIHAWHFPMQSRVS